MTTSMSSIAPIKCCIDKRIKCVIEQMFSGRKKREDSKRTRGKERERERESYRDRREGKKKKEKRKIFHRKWGISIKKINHTGADKIPLS